MSENTYHIPKWHAAVIKQALVDRKADVESIDQTQMPDQVKLDIQAELNVIDECITMFYEATEAPLPSECISPDSDCECDSCT